MTTLSSTVTEPEIPTSPAIEQFRPMRTLCAICTRLSILVFSPMTVSARAPRSTVELAPISTLSWMTHAADLRNALGAGRAGGKAETVLADPGAGVDDDLVAGKRRLNGCAGADVAVTADLAEVSR